MKCLKVPLKYDYMLGLQLLIDSEINRLCIDENDALIFANLMEVKHMIDKKLVENIKAQYTLKLSPAQAIALRIWYTDFIDLPATNYLGNVLGQISNETHKTFLV